MRNRLDDLFTESTIKNRSISHSTTRYSERRVEERDWCLFTNDGICTLVIQLTIHQHRHRRQTHSNHGRFVKFGHMCFDVMNMSKQYIQVHHSHNHPPTLTRPTQDNSSLTQPDISFTYTPTTPLLFTFSALTHNAHKIHYDQTWTREIGGSPGLIRPCAFIRFALARLGVKACRG